MMQELQLILSGIGVIIMPLMLLLIERNHRKRQDQHRENTVKLDHLHECIEEVKGRLIRIETRLDYG